MASKSKIILILIDALGAEYFARNRHRLPYLSKLADSGLFIERIKPAVPGTSRPGRATILTGQDTSINGVYGNSILLNDEFTPVSGLNIKATTVAEIGQASGLDVAGLGFGLLRPDHTACHIDPWWEHVALKSNIKIPNSRSSKTMAPIRRDPDGRLAGVLDGPAISYGPQESPNGILHSQMIGMASDQLMLQAAGDLACSDTPPDIIITEFSVTDTIQHYHGFESAATTWAYQAADMAVGLLLYRLELAKRLDDYVIMITSDHGQGPVHTAIYPGFLLPNHRWNSEGASLHVATEDEDDRARVNERLSQFGVAALDGKHLPEEALARGIVTYAAPDGFAFESPNDISAPVGEPTIVSTHGLRPGNAHDDGMAIIIGGDATGKIDRADLRIFAPTIAALAGLRTFDFPVAPITLGRLD
ncbi:alkaline phosphatase family protein [Sinorhizobium terangae]|uniref:alkaline phosphatase family protein n=1 Tax=Sinorhizobium terangae TaxID=110322 RepID=UPI0024B047C8|nr:alkaline phosphatase family protein [Sinorhizobium terangae]WFU51744.1 alkaline phosphatase family protein [Sinorhizobium terangae]